MKNSKVDEEMMPIYCCIYLLKKNISTTYSIIKKIYFLCWLLQNIFKTDILHYYNIVFDILLVQTLIKFVFWTIIPVAKSDTAIFSHFHKRVSYGKIFIFLKAFCVLKIF